MDKYDEFLEVYKEIYRSYVDRFMDIKLDTQKKIDALLADWGSRYPDEKNYFVFRRSLTCFEETMSPDWLKHQFDFFRQTDEKFADDEFDEEVKLV